jgi:Fe-S oxidoreductase/nitrate reductase gamma subunit
MNDPIQATREIYWNVSHVWVMYLLFAVALAVFGFGTYRRVRSWREGKADTERLSDWGARLKLTVVELLFQKRVRGSLVPGLFHSLVFYSFVVLTVTTAVVFLDADFHVHLFHGWLYVILTVGAELGGLLVLVGASMALWRRVVTRPNTLESCAADWIALSFLGVLALSGFLIEALRIATIGDPWAWLSPVGYALSFLFVGLSPDTNAIVHKVLWWGHTVVAMGWIATMPYTKFFHLVALPTNVFLSKLNPRGELARVDMEALMEAEDFDEDTFIVGVAKASDFTWKQRLDFDACVACGRCEEVCPATLTGHPFSPKTLIQRSRDLVRGLIPLKAAQATGTGTGAGNDGSSKGKGEASVAQDIVGGALDENFIWYCRTCTACMEVCPAAIDHVDTLMEIRRNELLIQGRVPHEAARALRQLENTGNPFGPPSTRSEFVEQHQVPVIAEGGEVDVLFWIGCCTTFDPTKQKIASDLFKLLRRSGISFGVLGEDERCCGDPARLIGDERLFQDIAKRQVAALNARKFKVLLVNCPHCFNVLRNEYPQFGGRYNVAHHSQFLHEMIWSGTLKPVRGRQSRLVYHDPCYLGRYQKIYDAPRQVLKALPGRALLEMGSSFKEHSLCCGGGGGHYWMDLKAAKERINNLRVDQAQATGADTIVTSCPYCQQMLNDSVKLRDLDENLRVIDIATAVLETLDEVEESPHRT